MEKTDLNKLGLHGILNLKPKYHFCHRNVVKYCRFLVTVSRPHCCAGAIGYLLRKLELPNPISRRLRILDGQQGLKTNPPVSYFSHVTSYLYRKFILSSVLPCYTSEVLEAKISFIITY